MLVRPQHVSKARLQLICRRAATTTPSAATLPPGSSLHRTNEHFTPLVEARPDFDLVTAMMKQSITRRGLRNRFPETFLASLAKQSADIHRLQVALQQTEEERVKLHQQFKAANQTKNVEVSSLVLLFFDA